MIGRLARGKHLRHGGRLIDPAESRCMMYATDDPLCISLFSTLAGVGLSWSDVTEQDDSDGSYSTALNTVIRAGLVDAKIEVVASVQGRLGTLRALYHCHGACGEMLNTEAIRHATHNPEWLDGNGGLVGPLIVKQRIRAVRLSATSIEARLDRPQDKLELLPELINRMVSDIRAERHWEAKHPQYEVLDTDLSARNGPDPDNECVLYWNGTAHRLTKRNWQLLRAIWGHDEVNLADVGELVWGDGLKPESTIRKQLNRLNVQIGTLDIPLAWRIEAGQILPEN